MRPNWRTEDGEWVLDLPHVTLRLFRSASFGDEWCLQCSLTGDAVCERLDTTVLRTAKTRAIRWARERAGQIRDELEALDTK
jgi:hypothetical protein